MFGFGGAARRKRAVAAINSSVLADVAALHPVERAIVLVLANSMLQTAAVMHGEGLANDPIAAGAAAADNALKVLLPRVERVAGIVADEASPNRRHAAVDLRASQLAALTIGVALDTSMRLNCRLAWMSAWEGRSRVKDAVTWIRGYEQASGVSATPLAAGQAVPSDVDLVRLGSSVPAFLRRKR